MDFLGYLILFGVGYLAVKAFGGSPSLFPGTDPKTGVPLINSSLFPGLRPGLVGPAPAPGRIPATTTATGALFCPTGTTLYKDTVDGKFYCYNPSDIAQAIGPVAGQPGYNDPLGGVGANVGAPTLTGAPQPTLDQLGLGAALSDFWNVTFVPPVNLGSSLDTPPPAPVAVPDYVVPSDTSAPNLSLPPGVFFV